jgi:hypothetical protein
VPTAVEDRAVTWGTAGKVFATVVTAVSLMAGGLLAFANVKSDTSLIKADVGTVKQTVAERKAYVDQKLAEHERRLEQQEHTVGEVNTKLEKALTLLERIDKKVGQP